MRRVPDFLPMWRVHRGFTLVEMIVSIVITGIIVAIVAMFGRQQVDAYLDVGNRAELSDAADTALRRIARDLQSALPNSVRVDATGRYLEFVPISDAGRYQADFGGDASDNPLDFGSSTDNSFRVFGPPVTINNGEQLVIFNLGLPGSDVYVGNNRKAADAGVNLQTVTYTVGAAQFPFPSPQSRFQIVAQPVSYVCDPAAGTIVRRSGYNFRDPQPTNNLDALGATSAVLVDNVAACNFSYAAAVLQRNGLAVLRLTLTRNGESVELLHQVEVLNTP